MPANFDNVLMIDGHGCLAPAGPLELEPGEEVLRLDAWVIQKSGACMAFLLDPIKGEKWTMKPDPHTDHFGDGFRPGPALGMGLMVSKKADGKTIAFQWTEAIQLK